MKKLTNEHRTALLADQQDELDASLIYRGMADRVRSPENREILNQIAADEERHYRQLSQLTEEELKPRRLRIFFYMLIARFFGLTFAFKLLENAEVDAQRQYGALSESFPEVEAIQQDEEKHERQLIDILDEKKLNYMGSIVLGLNDALVELTGALAGYTFAIQHSRNIALLGLITGISASLSMGASEYLSKKQEKETAAFRSSLYTGIAYILTVTLLILPFLLFPNPFINLGISLGVALLIILSFNYYISVAKDLSFRKRFFEMAGISMGVALLSFVIGWAVRKFLGFEL